MAYERKTDYCYGYDDEERLQSIRNATEKLGRPPTYDEFGEMDGPSTSTLENHFGTWTRAKRLAGVDDKRKNGKLPVNESYFSEIDNTEKAYWLGMLYADGAVYVRGNSNSHIVSLCLIDREHVVAFKKAVDAEYGVKEQKDGTHDITITSEKMADDLRDCGCDRDKTFSPALPELESDRLRAAFVRGLYDGDGHLASYDTFQITGVNKERFEKVLSWLPSGGYVTETDEKQYIYVRQKHGVEKLWSWLYPDGPDTEPALERKIPTDTTYNDH